MAVLDSWLAGIAAVALVVRVALAVSLISIIGIALAGCYRHQAAARHFVLLTALVCALVSPAVATVFLTERLSPLVLTLPAALRSAAVASVKEVQAFSRSTELELAPVPSNRSLDSQRTMSKVAKKPGPQAPVSPIAGDVVSKTEKSAPNRSLAFPDLDPRGEKEASPVVLSPEVSPAAEASFKPAQAGLTLALAVWGAGSLFLFFRVLRGWLRLRAAARSFRFHNSGTIVDLLEEARQVVRGRRLPRVADSDRVCTPIAAGLFRPVIVLPSGLLTTLAPAELRDVLIHEFAHIVRLDQLVIVLQAVAHVTYWPIWPVHWLNRLLANAREEVCDNYVLARQQPVTYGETLLRVAALSQNLATFDTSTAILGWRGRLEDRVVELISERRNRSTRVKPIVAGSLLAVLALATGGLCGTTLALGQGESPRPDVAAAATRSPAAASVDVRAPREVRVVEINESERLRAPSTPAEKAVAKLMLVFYQDRARRAIYGIVLDAGDHSLIFTTSLAARVPDDLPPAIDATFLERASKPALEVIYDSHSNAEVFAYRAVGHLSSYQFALSPAVAVGDALDAATSRRVGEIEIRPHAANVLAVNQEASVTMRDSTVQRFSSLIEIDGGGFDGSGFPEGTPFFKDGKLVGMSVVGTRFSKSASKLSYLVPVERMAALYQTIKKVERMAALYQTIKKEEIHAVVPEFPCAVPFELGETKFLNGDEITILEVRGTADSFATENIYWIKGTYTLTSHDQAALQASITATDSGTSTARGFSVKAQNLIVSQGTGTFTLFLPMTYSGYPHVSFYPVDGGNGFGGVYFGTGNLVHRQGGDRGGESPDAKRIWDALGLRVSQIDRKDARLVTMRYDGGLQITDVRPDSPASRSELRKDDIIVGLDRYATTRLTDAIWTLDHPRVDEPVLSQLRFHAVRDGARIFGDLKLVPGN